MQKRRYIVSDQPDLFREAQQLMSRYFDHQLSPELAGTPFEETNLVSREDSFRLPLADIHAEYADVLAFSRQCKKQAVAILNGQQDVLTLHQIGLDPNPENKAQGFLESALSNMSPVSAKALTLADFTRGCLLQTYDLAGEEDLLSQADQDGLDRMLSPDYAMEDILLLLDKTTLSQGEQMTLLRFFQQIDTWHARIQDLLIQLEAVVRDAFPLIAARFEEKVREVKAAGDQAAPIQFIQQMGTDLSALRADEPVIITIWLVVYNGMGFRFSEDRRQPLLTMYGLLFDELGKLKDALAMRQELTERQLKALADPNRLRIIRSLRGGERFARQLSDELGLTPATVSHHLNILLVAFLVGSRLEGRNVYYRLNNKGLAGLAEDLRKLAGDVKEDRDDA